MRPPGGRFELADGPPPIRDADHRLLREFLGDITVAEEPAKDTNEARPFTTAECLEAVSVVHLLPYTLGPTVSLRANYLVEAVRSGMVDEAQRREGRRRRRRRRLG